MSGSVESFLSSSRHQSPIPVAPGSIRDSEGTTVARPVTFREKLCLSFSEADFDTTFLDDTPMDNAYKLNQAFHEVDVANPDNCHEASSKAKDALNQVSIYSSSLLKVYY